MEILNFSFYRSIPSEQDPLQVVLVLQTYKFYACWKCRVLKVTMATPELLKELFLAMDQIHNYKNVKSVLWKLEK